VSSNVFKHAAEVARVRVWAEGDAFVFDIDEIGRRPAVSILGGGEQKLWLALCAAGNVDESPDDRRVELGAGAAAELVERLSG
jgi:hypothetical protein